MTTTNTSHAALCAEIADLRQKLAERGQESVAEDHAVEDAARRQRNMIEMALVHLKGGRSEAAALILEEALI